jgi:hypothetical protein
MAETPETARGRRWCHSSAAWMAVGWILLIVVVVFPFPWWW